jgi:hypothetical protein
MISCWSCIEVNKWISTGTGEIDTETGDLFKLAVNLIQLFSENKSGFQPVSNQR